MTTRTEFIEKASKLHNNKYDYSKVPMVFKMSNIKENKIPIVCPIHGTFYQTPWQHLSSTGCEQCSYIYRGSKNKMTLDTFISRANKIHNGKYDYSKVVLGKTLRVPVKIICPAHGEFEKRPDKHLSGQGCQKCVKCHRRSEEDFLKTIKSIYGNKYDFSKVKFKTVRDKVIIGCPVHGDTEVVAMRLILGLGCTKCNIHRSEQLVMSFLDKFGIKYIREFKLKNSEYSNLKYDFYLPDINIIIEVDGAYHTKEITGWGGKEYLEEVMRKDVKKTKEAKKHGIPVYRIQYSKNMPSENMFKELLNILAIFYPYSDGKKLFKTLAALKSSCALDPNLQLSELAALYSTKNNVDTSPITK